MDIIPYRIKKANQYLKHYGPKALVMRFWEKMKPDEVPYGPWYAVHKASQEQLIRQREQEKKFSYRPQISIVVPCYETPKEYLVEMMESVFVQSYCNWQLCLADASKSPKVEACVINFIRKHEESRFSYQKLEKNRGISENTNAGIAMATGEWIGLLDHDDALAPDALFELVSKMNQCPELELVYTDEDKIKKTRKGWRHVDPHFKPEFSIDLLRSNNYITHFLCVKRSIIEQVGGFRKEFDGAQDYDFILRCSEHAKQIGHVPRILYHWRMHANSTSNHPQSKLYAYKAGKKAVQEHLKRVGEKGKVSQLMHFGFYRVQYEVQGSPLVSILIPNKDQVHSLRPCLDSIKRSSYKNYEVIIIKSDKESSDPAILNFGANLAKGEYLLFLDPGIEIMTENWLEEMLGNCQRPQIGTVGIKLYHPNHSIRHAGIVVGMGGVAGNVFQGLRHGQEGYLHKASLQLNYSAVTAACMMVKRSVFQEVGGFDEKLAYALHDVDFCLRLGQAGYLVVYDPYVEAYDYESSSNRPKEEREFFRRRWISLLKSGDPYYNPNFSLKKFHYSLKPFKL